MRPRYAALFVFATLLACDDLTAPRFPNEALVQFTPPSVFALWWQQVETCAGRRADFSRMRWYRPIDGASLELADGGTYQGYWWDQGDRIALANVDHGPTARHEMLHAILNDGSHPLPMFAGPCAGVVGFDGPEGYGVPVAELQAAVSLPAATALKVTVATHPAAPSLNQYGGAFTLVVTATNTIAQPVWINVDEGDLASVFVTDAGFGAGVVTAAKRILFLPGQSRQVFVDWTESRSGALRVQGSYLRARSEVTTFTIAP
ncbi:hypothetical protein [Gemmatimonas groenlandica]|uniref:Uncharacterized protein n=1 Tax=Gemmatimonas groenlandica TaxID=2732249 RepID=A0A6M4ITV6_9BACT|nr:hypothetical protein [Gemmatimonas groenlandica]QJR37635.1 hypothetical protein HKW67_19980 [Gemmatimonas groenlandica]